MLESLAEFVERLGGYSHPSVQSSYLVGIDLGAGLTSGKNKASNSQAVLRREEERRQQRRGEGGNCICFPLCQPLPVPHRPVCPARLCCWKLPLLLTSCESALSCRHKPVLSLNVKFCSSSILAPKSVPVLWRLKPLRPCLLYILIFPASPSSSYSAVMTTYSAQKCWLFLCCVRLCHYYLIPEFRVLLSSKSPWCSYIKQ